MIKTENAWLMFGNCLDRMKEIPDGSVDMVLTDPPYELSKSKGGGMMSGGRKFMRQVRDAGMIDGINTESFLDICLAMFSHKQKFCGVFTCSNKQVIEYISWAESNGFQYGIGVWQKTNPAPLCNCKYLNDVEYWIYIKGDTSKINKADKAEFGHPTCKPVELMEKFIVNHTEPGGVVVDPFMGSGSTGVACANTGRKFIGIELDPTYYGIACERVLAEAPTL